MKHVSILFATALALAAPVWAAASPEDTTRYGSQILDYDLVLHPARPCAGGPALLYVRGFEATPCDSFLGMTRIPGQPITIRTLIRRGYSCLVGPSVFFSLPVQVGPLAAGYHSFVVRRRQLWLNLDGSIDSTTTDTTYTFQVGPACTELPVLPAADLSLVERAFTSPDSACAAQPVGFVLAGHFTDGCGRVVESSVVDPLNVRLTLAPVPPVRRPCTEALEPWRATYALGYLPPGPHAIGIDLTIQGSNAFWPPVPERQERGRFDFTVEAGCDSLGLPYVEAVDFLRPCGLPVCPGEPITVQLSGWVPDACCRRVYIETFPSPIVGPAPEPDVVRVVLDSETFVRCACGPGLVRWSTRAVLPGLPARDYRLMVEVVERNAGRDSLLGSTTVPFVVSEGELCGPYLNCLATGWERGSFSCNAEVSPGLPAHLTFTVATDQALAGLQGRFRWLEPGMRITGMEAIGPAAGMRLEWTQAADGASFVLFSSIGAPIPAEQLSPILKVAVALDAAAATGPFHLQTTDVLGANAQGGAVPVCLPLPCADPALRIQPLAVVCVATACDFNADGGTDVRDIVLMVRCALYQEGCPPSPAANFDCDADGHFTPGDVMCCARHLLRTLGCPQCPIDSVRAEPEVLVGLGAPRPFTGGIDVPLRIEGAERIGGTQLRLRFPADRFTATLIGSGPFLGLHEVFGDRITVGLIGGVPLPALPADAAYQSPYGLTVRLTLRPGASIGGELQIEETQTSGLDGILLDITDGPSSATLTVAGIAMSPPRPNPFAEATGFSVTLEAPARLEVSVHDLTGRRVADLFRGPSEAGARNFVWNGIREGGGAAPSGVYFVRVAADGRLVTRKVVLVRGPSIRTGGFTPVP